MHEGFIRQDTQYAEARAINSEGLQRMYESRLISLESLLQKILLKVTEDKLLCAMADEEIEPSYLLLRTQEIIESQLNNQRERLIQDLSQRLAEESNGDFYKRELENVKELFERELDQMEKDLKKFKRKYEEKVSINSQLIGENERLLDRISELENQRESSFNGEVKKLKEEINKLKKNSIFYDSNKKELEIELEECKRVLAVQKEEISESKCDLKALEILRSKYNSLQDSYKCIQRENSDFKEKQISEKRLFELQNSNEKLHGIISSLEYKLESESKEHLETKKVLRMKTTDLKRQSNEKHKLLKSLKVLRNQISPLKKELITLLQETQNYKLSFKRFLIKSQEKSSAKFLHEDLTKGRLIEKLGGRIEELMEFLDISEGNEAALMKVNTKAFWRIEELEKRIQYYEKEEDEHRYTINKTTPPENKNNTRIGNKRSVSWHLKPRV